jgi:hypothetical protein
LYLPKKALKQGILKQWIILLLEYTTGVNIDHCRGGQVNCIAVRADKTRVCPFSILVSQFGPGHQYDSGGNQANSNVFKDKSDRIAHV